MLIIPAVDIMGGKVVRLFKGKFDDVTEYGEDPLEMALHWEVLGAQYLHVVDLDGAESGKRHNQQVIKQIARKLKIPIEVGGGIRSRDVVDEYLNAGVARVVLGTKVVVDHVFLTDILKSWDDRISVSLDCSNGFVTQRGWVETSGVKGVDLAAEFIGMGLKNIIYTDISRDGTMTGPNIEGLLEILDVGDVNVIASGGVKNLDDIKALLALKRDNLHGVITGRAIYEGTLDIKEAMKL